MTSIKTLKSENAELKKKLDDFKKEIDDLDIDEILTKSEYFVVHDEYPRYNEFKIKEIIKQKLSGNHTQREQGK